MTRPARRREKAGEWMQHWTSFMYLYGVGGLIFGAGLFLGVRKRVLKFERRSDRRLFAAILGAYFFYFMLQGAWNLAALNWRPAESESHGAEDAAESGIRPISTRDSKR